MNLMNLEKASIKLPGSIKSGLRNPGMQFPDLLYDKRVVEISRNIKPSARGELEITDVNRVYLEAGTFHVKLL
jgi:glucose-1-phosphate thymidylyltransferase